MNSIYSSLNKRKKLWIVNKALKLKDVKNILDKQNLKIKTKEKTTKKSKTFILTIDNLYYIQKDTVKGYFNYNYIGLKYNNYKKKIVLFNNFKYFNLYFEESIIYKKWKNFFKKKCTMNNFHEKFAYIKNLGYGGNSVVKLSKNLINNKLYAVKKISKSEKFQTEKIRSVINEIDIMKNWDHINVVKFYYLYECSKNFYLVLEYCNFSSLKDFLKKNKSENKDKSNLVKGILEGLIYINSKNIVHRDLKPDNIFLHITTDNQIIPKIGDFGLSNFLNKEFIYKRCGTPGFIAPEVLRYEKGLDFKIDSKVDIYSFGHLIYIIFTNSFLFEYENINDLILNNSNNYYSLKKDLNKSLEEIIKLCLIGDPNIRINLVNLKKFISNFIN